MKLLFHISVTLLKARLKQSIVAAVGVTFGITMFVTLLSFMSGLNNMLDGLIGNRTAHVRLYNEVKVNAKQPITLSHKDTNTHDFISSIKAANARQDIYNANKIIQNLEKDTRVLGYSRRLSTQVFFNAGASDLSGFLSGIDAEKEVKFFHFGDYITTGEAKQLMQVSNSIILGKPLAEKLMADIGDVVQVTTANGERFQLKVVAYYQSGVADYDKTQSFASNTTVQKVMGKGNGYITDLQVKLKDLSQAPAIAKEYAQVFEMDAIDIQSANAQFETGTKVRNIISYAVGISLLIVAGFGIYNILNMMIYEKMDTIAILKATGFSGTDVKRVFLMISVIIGLIGCAAGMVFSTLLINVISHIPFNSAAIPTVKTFPVVYSWVFYAIALSFTFATTWFAGWFPANKASKVDPVIIIRGK
ncbi:MAG: ABC transporter permease [Bacteroidetes bacterium]|nr:ABC transporter permease [Bacteroidota bacterium]